MVMLQKLSFFVKCQLRFYHQDNLEQYMSFLCYILSHPCQPLYDIIKFNIFFANALHPDHEGVCEKNVKQANFVNADV